MPTIAMILVYLAGMGSGFILGMMYLAWWSYRRTQGRLSKWER